MICYVALGANLGDRAANIHLAVARLAASDEIKVCRLSSLMETAAVGGPPGSPPFLNAVAQIQTSLPPRDLLDRLLQIETEMGRRRRRRWAPRTIDLDLLLYGDRTIDEPGLCVPHPRMHERRFVLAPLAELSPDLRHPIHGKSAQTLLDELPPGQ